MNKKKSKEIISKVEKNLYYAQMHLMNARGKILNSVLENFEIMREGQKLYDNGWKKSKENENG